MRENMENHLQDAVPDNEDERRVFKSQMMGFVLLPVAGMALLGLIIVLIEVF